MSTRQLHVRVDGRCAAAYGPCTRPCNVSCTRPYNVSCACYMAAVYTAVNTPSPAKTARTRPCNGRAVYTARRRPCTGRAHGPCTPLVYMTVHGPSVRTSSAVYMARTRPRTRDVYTALYWSCTRPCTRHVYGRVHVSACLRVQGPFTRPCTGHLLGRKHPSTPPYTAV